MDAVSRKPRDFGGSAPLALIALVASNLLPLAGVFLWGWDVGSLVVLYWSENLILGAYTLLKILVLARIKGLLAGAFFTLHYGGFCAVHGVFVLVLAMDQEPQLFQDEPWPLWLIFLQLLIDVVRQVLAMAPAEWLVAFGALATSHGLSLWLNYFRGGEYRHQSVNALMGAPYKRIVVLHAAIIAGGFGVMALGSPMALLVLLVVLKLGLDVYLLRREHRRAGLAEGDAPGQPAAA